MHLLARLIRRPPLLVHARFSRRRVPRWGDYQNSLHNALGVDQATPFHVSVDPYPGVDEQWSDDEMPDLRDLSSDEESDGGY